MVKGTRKSRTKGEMSLAVGGDHAGFPLKGPVIEFLRGLGHAVLDCGSYDPALAKLAELEREAAAEWAAHERRR
jgi:ribose 5-phosphate isomerase B